MSDEQMKDLEKESHEKEPKETIWEHWSGNTEVFIGTIILFSVITIIAGFISYLMFSSHIMYSRASYKYETNGLLVDIVEYQDHEERWKKSDLSGSDKEGVVVEDYKVYELTWEYEFNNKIETIVQYKRRFNLSEIGDTRKLYFYSQDGKTYKIKPYSRLTDTISIVCGFLFIIGLYMIIRVLIQRIKFIKMKRRVK
ncbi:MAG: hypothetical protein K6E10_12530 [Eubacterium sp.]|nr:hypothetical protein [Eubacterium sp.]